jgi:hypothetical protein
VFVDGLVIALTLLVLAVAIVALAVHLRRTPSVGSVDLKDASGSRLAINTDVTKALAGRTSGRQVLSISMRTVRTADGTGTPTETITVDGQSYGSIDEIPPEVRERVRALLAKAQKPGTGSIPGGEAAIVKIEDDLAALGLDLRDPAVTLAPPSAPSSDEPPESPAAEPPNSA